MKVRGTRECKACGDRWSYYESGSVTCPSCGSLRSVGVDEERRLHTASAASLDLTSARDALDDDAAGGEGLRRAAKRAVEETRAFVRGYGFIDGGRLQLLDDTYLAAVELRAVADAVGRAARLDDDEELYFLTLLRGADAGERPAVEEVPDSVRDSRGLAYANAVETYLRDLRANLDEHPDPLVGESASVLREHVRRVQALDGDVPPGDAEQLVRAARGLGDYLRADDEGALAEARDRIDRLG